MKDIIGILNSLLVKGSKRYIDIYIEDIFEHLHKYRNYSNDELKEKCLHILNGSESTNLDKKKYSFLQKMIDRLFSMFIRRVNDVTIRNLSIAIEAFRRVPCDLPMGSELYSQQIRAAVALTQKSVIQMDTGEGKTYVLLPAGFALYCQYGKVYIVCPNRYLAYRDATRTREYWNYIGLSVGLAIELSERQNWLCNVVYTTLEDLIFQHLREDLKENKSKYKINFGALLLDEADAILLDQADQNYIITSEISSKAFDWRNAINYSKNLIEDQDVHVDRIEMSAFLTTSGEKKLRNMVGVELKGEIHFQSIKYAVEVAFIAINIIKQDIHYIIKENMMHPVDVLTGKVCWNQTRDWLIPLEFLNDISVRHEKVTLHQLSANNFIKHFSHMSGLSGSIREDVLEYFFAYWLPAIIIEPVQKKHDGVLNDRIYKTKHETYRNLCIAVIEALIERRPILIGCQSIEAAEVFFSLLVNHKDFPKFASPKLITGKDESGIAKIFNEAGKVGSVIVSTQLAGRGVDIRLSEEAIKNGGLFLFCLEHSIEMRYDNQFLGRAGRQGDPFTAVFYCSLDDDLFKIFGGERISKILDGLGMEEDESIEHSFITKAIINAQRMVRQHSFYKRRSQEFIESSMNSAYTRIKPWFDYCQLTDNDSDVDCSEIFIEWTIHGFIHHHLLHLLEENKIISFQDAKQVVMLISNALGFDQNQDIIHPSNIEGRKGGLAAKEITDRLADELVKKQKANKHNIKNYNKMISDYIEKYSMLHDFESQLTKKEGEFFEKIKSISYGNFDYSNNQEVRSLQYTSNAETNHSFNQVASLAKEVFKEETKHQCLILLYKGNIPSKTYIDEFMAKINEIEESESDNEESLKVCYSLVKITLKKLREVINTFKVNNEDFIKAHQLMGRTSKNIAHTTIGVSWINFLRETERIRNRAAHQTLNPLDFNRIVCDEILEEWERVECQMPAFVLYNLFRADQPELLEDIYFYQNNKVSGKNENLPDCEFGNIWDNSFKSKPDESFNVESNEKRLIAQFVESHLEDMNHSFVIESLQQLLEDFTTLFPINTLQSPDKIHTALKSWYKTEIRRGIAKKRRKINHIWLKKFLIFLNVRKVIAPLPTLRNRFKSAITVFFNNLSDMKTSIPLAQALLWGLLFVLITILGDWGVTRQFHGVFHHMDNLLFGGLFGKGIITAPAFGAIVLTLIITNNISLAIVIYVFIILCSWWITDWHVGDWSIVKGIQSLLFFSASTYIAFMTYRITDNTDKLTGIFLPFIWIIYASLFVFMPTIIPYFSNTFWFWIVLISIYLVWEGKINIDEFVFASSHLQGSTVSMKSETLRSCRKVKGSCGARPHVYALILSWFVFQGLLLIQQEIGGIQFPVKIFFIISVFSYYTISIFITVGVMKKRFSLNLWKENLTQKREVLIDGTSEKELKELNLEEELKKVYRSFLAKEISFQTVLLFTAIFFLYPMVLPSTQFPLVLVVVFLVYLIGDLLYKTAGQLYSVLITRAPMSYEALDLSTIREPEEDASLLGRIREILEPVSKVAFYLKIIFFTIIIIFYSWKFFKLFFH